MNTNNKIYLRSGNNEKKQKAVVIFLALVFVGCSFGITSCSVNPRKENAQKFVYTDGSVLISDGYPQVFHNLFDDYYVCNQSDDRFSQYVAVRHFNGISYDEKYLTEPYCYFDIYAFSADEYIAYDCYALDKSEEAVTAVGGMYTEKYTYYEDKYPISEHYAGLYDCKEEKELRFSSFDDLLDYAQDNSIRLGELYSISSYGGSAYKEVVSVSDWRIAEKNETSRTFVNKHEAFNASVKKYAVENGFLFVELKADDESSSLFKSDYYSLTDSTDLNASGTVFIRVNTSTNEVKTYSDKKQMHADNPSFKIKMIKPKAE